MKEIKKQISKAIKTIRTINTPKNIPEFNTALAALKFAKMITKERDFELTNTYFLKMELDNCMKRRY